VLSLRAAHRAVAVRSLPRGVQRPSDVQPLGRRRLRDAV